MADIKRLLEKMNQFAGQAVGQKPGDQVRGTEKATKKKSGDHPFKGRLVGGESQENFLQELEVELKEGALKRELTNELNLFKTSAPVKPAPRRSTSYIDPNKHIPYPDIRAGAGEAGVDDYNYSKGGQQFTLHREGGAFQLILNNKVLQQFTAPQRNVHDYLIQNGYKLLPPAVNKTTNKNWFQEGEENPTDTVSMDVPLLIRVMEYAKEDAKDDMDLHRVAEKLISMSNEGRTLSMDDYDSVVGSNIETEDTFGYKHLKHDLTKAKQQFPMAKSDIEAMLLHVQDKEQRDVETLDNVNDREDAAIAQLDKEDNTIEQQLVNLSKQIKGLEALLASKRVKEDIPPAVPTAGGPAGAAQPKPNTDPQQLALQKQQQAKLQQNLANLKTAGVDIDPAKAAQTLQKTDTGAPMNAVDKDTISKLAPAIGNVMSNPSTATQLNTLIKKAGGGQ